MTEKRCKNPFVVWLNYLATSKLQYNRYYFFYLLNGERNGFSYAIWDYNHPEYFDRCPLAN